MGQTTFSSAKSETPKSRVSVLTEPADITQRQAEITPPPLNAVAHARFGPSLFASTPLVTQANQTGMIQRNPLDFILGKQKDKEDKKLDKASQNIPNRGIISRPTDTSNLNSPDNSSKVLGGVETGAGLGSALLGVADSTLAQTSGTPKNFATGSNMDISAGNSNFDSATDKQSQHGVNSSTASSGVGIGTGALASIAHFASFAQAIKQSRSGATKEERADAKVDATQHGIQGTANAGQSAANVAGMVTNLVGSSAGNNTSTGIADILGGFGDAVDLLFTIGKGIRGLLKDLDATKGDKKARREVWLEARAGVAREALPTINKILSVGLSIMSGVRYIMAAWNAGGPFVDAFPIIGASIGIFIKLLNIVQSMLQIVKKVKSILKSIINSQAAAQSTIISDETKELLAEINDKRKVRAQALIFTEAVRIIGDFTGIAGNILQIVGVATSGAMGGGAGVYAAGIATTAAGALLKVGASGIEAGMAATRFVKQSGRDYAEKKEEQGKSATILGIEFDTGKSSKKKHAAYALAADNILDAIQIFYTNLADPSADDDTKANQYKEVLEIVRTTGVSKKELFNTTDWGTAQGLLIEAMKKRQ